jgi:hypothetical protein
MRNRIRRSTSASRRAAARAFDAAIGAGRSVQSARMLGLNAGRRSLSRASGS